MKAIFTFFVIFFSKNICCQKLNNYFESNFIKKASLKIKEIKEINISNNFESIYYIAQFDTIGQLITEYYNYRNSNTADDIKKYHYHQDKNKFSTCIEHENLGRSFQIKDGASGNVQKSEYHYNDKKLLDTKKDYYEYGDTIHAFYMYDSINLLINIKVHYKFNKVLYPNKNNENNEIVLKYIYYTDNDLRLLRFKKNESKINKAPKKNLQKFY